MVGTDGLSQTCNSVGAGLTTPGNGGDSYCTPGGSSNQRSGARSRPESRRAIPATLCKFADCGKTWANWSHDQDMSREVTSLRSNG